MKMNKLPGFSVYSFQSRLFSVTAMVGFGLLIVLGRVFYLQIWNPGYYNDLASRQQERTIELKSKRQAIYDRRKRLLATSIKVDSVHALPAKVRNPEKTAKQLSPLLGIKEGTLLKKLKSPRSFVWLKRQNSPATTAKIKRLKIKGIDFIQEYKRYYPYGKFAGPLLGFTGIDPKGLEGLEYEYQDLLQGEKNQYVVEQDGTHRIIPSKDYQMLKPSQHYSLHLTLDNSIQYFAEKALRKGIAKAQAKKGIAIVMETQTGAILAIANSPDFDPNNFQQYPHDTYLNHAVTSGYEPGSTLKILTIAIAYEERFIDIDQKYFCEDGSFQVADQVIHDVTPHGWLNVREIIQKSSNICAAKIGFLISKEQFFDYLKKFGFGQKIDIGLPAEASGSLPLVENWTRVDHASISFGHGILSSPMQLLTAINTIGTHGFKIIPYIVDYIEDEKGESIREIKDSEGVVIQRFGPREKTRILSAKTADTIRDFMISVTEEGGTGTLAAISGVSVAGKTGTSEIYDEKMKAYSKKDNIASFIGMVPAENPELTILVVVESPQTSSYGGVVAAPIFREIAERSLFFLGKGFPKIQQ
ncbi:MAG: penicillin-binding protein 2 [SAR324 cluster bacterium]|nr:penicillin-binding protein 2 [SAR324 cluster bacterium]